MELIQVLLKLRPLHLSKHPILSPIKEDKPPPVTVVYRDAADPAIVIVWSQLPGLEQSKGNLRKLTPA